MQYTSQFWKPSQSFSFLPGRFLKGQRHLYVPSNQANHLTRFQAPRSALPGRALHLEWVQ
jgi:hypothetical protein